MRRFEFKGQDIDMKRELEKAHNERKSEEKGSITRMRYVS